MDMNSDHLKWTSLKVVLLACLAALLLISCGSGGSSPSNPSTQTDTHSQNTVFPSDAGGLWVGTWTGTGVAIGYKGLTVVEVHQNGTTISGYATIPFLNLFNVSVTGTVQGSSISFGDVNQVIQYTGEFTGLVSAGGTYHSTARWGSTDGSWSMTQMMAPFTDSSPAQSVSGVWCNSFVSAVDGATYNGALDITQDGSGLSGNIFSSVNQGLRIYGRVSGNTVWALNYTGNGSDNICVIAGSAASTGVITGKYVCYNSSDSPETKENGSWNSKLAVMMVGAIPGTLVSNTAGLDGPTGIAVGTDGNIYVADTQNHVIREITSSGIVTVLAGKTGEYGNTNGQGEDARFNKPTSVAADTLGNLYVIDSQNESVRKIIVSTGDVSTVMTNPDWIYPPYGIAVDSTGNAYVSSQISYMIKKITPAGSVSTVAGTDHVSGRALAVDLSGNIYVADDIKKTIVKITASGQTSILAGSENQSGMLDGTGADARFKHLQGICSDGSGNLFIADDTIRKITPAGVVSTVFNPGVSTSGVAADGMGRVYFTVDSAVLYFFL